MHIFDEEIVIINFFRNSKYPAYVVSFGGEISFCIVVSFPESTASVNFPSQPLYNVKMHLPSLLLAADLYTVIRVTCQRNQLEKL